MGVFGEALLELWGGSTPGTHSLFSWSGGLQARLWQCLGESSFPVVLDFRSSQLLRSALRVGARSGTGSLFTLGAQKEPRTLLALGQLNLTEELEIRAPEGQTSIPNLSWKCAECAFASLYWLPGWGRQGASIQQRKYCNFNQALPKA